MGGGGKGGSQSTEIQIPAWAERAMQENLRKAQRLGEVGYMPFYGGQVAALDPVQEQLMQKRYDRGAALGLVDSGVDVLAGMPEAQEFDMGDGQTIRGYGSGGLFESARNEFIARNPDQARAFFSEFKPFGTEETRPPEFTDPGDGRPPGMSDEMWQYVQAMQAAGRSGIRF